MILLQIGLCSLFLIIGCCIGYKFALCDKNAIHKIDRLLIKEQDKYIKGLEGFNKYLMAMTDKYFNKYIEATRR